MELSGNEKMFIRRVNEQLRENNSFNESYKEMYNSFDEDLAICCSSFHFILNKTFNYMNGQLSSRYFHADNSRDVIDLIERINLLISNLKSIKLKINKYYFEIINKLTSFLSQYRGTEVPIDFEKIQIIETNPIFHTDTIIIIENKMSDLQRHGEGSYAIVYKYYDKFYDETFIIKKAKSNLDEKELERFKKEFETMKSLNSLFVTKVYTFNSEKNEYTMEFLDYTLEKYLKNFKKSMIPLDKIKLINHILRAFEFINSKGYLHRDISPNNILIKNYPDMPVIKLSDFGLVKEKERTLTSINSEIRGSFNDFTGLRKKGFSNYSITDETYALTLLIIYILTGKFDNYHKIKNQMLKDFLNKGTSPNIEERFKSINELREAFSKIKNNVCIEGDK